MYTDLSRELTDTQITSVMQLLHTIKGQSKPRSFGDIYPMSEAEITECNGIIRRQLWTAEYKDSGFDVEHPDCFGNLARYALVRKHRQGVSIQAQAHLWRRVLTDCHDWPTDVKGFRRRLDEYLGRLEGAKSDRTGRPLSRQSYNHVLSILQTIWAVAVSMEMVESNPITADRYPRKKTKARKRTLSRRETTGMLWHLRSVHRGLYWAMRFCLKNPCGYGDVRRLRCVDVDFETMTVSYARKKTSVEARPIIHPELEAYCRRRVAGGHDRLFDLPGDYRYPWRLAMWRSGTTNLTWHDLRHHAATWLAQKGIPLHIITAIGGWSTVQMVERYHDLRSDSAAILARKMLTATSD